MNGYDCVLCDETHDLGEIYDESALVFCLFELHTLFFQKCGVGFGDFLFCFVFLIRW